MTDVLDQLVRWGAAIESALNSIDLLPGDGEFTLWALLKGLVVITVFLLIASLISRFIERRVMKMMGVAPSTRIGISKFTHFFLIGFAALLGINAAGVDLTAITVLTGAMGLGLG